MNRFAEHFLFPGNLFEQLYVNIFTFDLWLYDSAECYVIGHQPSADS